MKITKISVIKLDYNRFEADFWDLLLETLLHVEKSPFFGFVLLNKIFNHNIHQYISAVNISGMGSLLGISPYPWGKYDGFSLELSS